MLVEKFVEQTREVKQSSRLIRIDGLPRTVTTQDILKLAREAFKNGDKSVVDMAFSRKKKSFRMTGKCIILMASIEEARRFILYGHQRYLGGNKMHMSFDLNKTPENYLKMIRHIGLKSENTSSGCSVLISGFPSYTAKYLLNHLSKKDFYPADGVTDNVVRLRSKREAEHFKYVIKFETESEAWRCVRTFHNSAYTVHSTQKTHIIQTNVVY
ncbi:hypothetical protein BY458DRAFT_433963 [Sporodiniella umbellata]|nr:hypothetical protein BY458DRAFT_433963 [Sporodiniella umbellata]